MAKALPVMVQKGVKAYMDDHPGYRIGMAIPTISIKFIKPDNTTEEVTYDGLIAYYKQAQEKGKRSKNEA